VLNLEPGAGPSALPCEGCPQQALLEYLGSPGGLIIQSTIDLDFSLQAGITVRLDEIPYPVFLLLRQLTEERDKFQAEEIRKGQKRD
jgi:hypothetical protein